MEEVPDFCIICGEVCGDDPDYCDKHLAEKQQEREYPLFNEILSNL
jgi:hypothetical protein